MKGKAIIFVGVLMGLVAAALVLLLVNQQSAVSATGPTPVPLPVVRAAQNIPKGEEIRLESVQLVQLDQGEPVPANAVRDPMKAVGMTAAIDIPQGAILQGEMYFDRDAAVSLGKQGASDLIRPGRLAMAVPAGDLARVAGAVRDGDRVNVIATFEMVEVERDAQLRKPLDGTGDQYPRLVTQTILQDVEVLRVGPWMAAAAASDGDQAAGAPVATSDVVTLLVTPQDSVVLKWLVDLASEGEAMITFALRSGDEVESPETESATLEYLMRRFRVAIPPKLDVTTDTITVKGSVEPR